MRLKRLARAGLVALAFSSFPVLADRLPENYTPVQSVQESNILGTIGVAQDRSYIEIYPADYSYSVRVYGHVNIIKRPRLAEEGVLKAEFKVNNFFPEVYINKGVVLVGDKTNSKHYFVFLRVNDQELVKKTGRYFENQSYTSEWRRASDDPPIHYYKSLEAGYMVFYDPKDDEFVVVMYKDNKSYMITLQVPEAQQTDRYKIRIEGNVLSISSANRGTYVKIKGETGKLKFTVGKKGEGEYSIVLE